MNNYETDKYEAFELVANALDNLDDFQETGSNKALEEANKGFSDAAAKDPNYFGAQYFRAMTDYFSGHEAQAIKWFRVTLDPASKENKGGVFINEMRYNLGAALYENRTADAKNLGLAITEFKRVRRKTRVDDPVLNTLARAGLATAYVEKFVQLSGSNPSRYRRLAEKLCAEVQQDLWRDNDFIWRMSFKRKIDKEVARQIQEITNEARARLVKSESNSDRRGHSSENAATADKVKETAPNPDGPMWTARNESYEASSGKVKVTEVKFVSAEPEVFLESESSFLDYFMQLIAKLGLDLKRKGKKTRPEAVKEGAAGEASSEKAAAEDSD